MNSEDTDPPTGRICQRCGATLPIGQEACRACLLSDLRSSADTYFEPPPASGQPLEGSGFRVLEEIGRGGMGIVFRGRQMSPVRDVAIKVLLPHLVSSPDVRRRLLSEAEAMAELNHPGILPLYASGESDGRPWLAMKLATGGTLAARRAEWVGRWRAVAELLAGLADAVQHAHERGLIHRDVKPGNVLFDEQDRACLADFGLAKWQDREASDTMSHVVMGTPAYMPPEVARAGASAATTASDVYGLGAMLYELLTGVPPFKGVATAELLQKIAADEPSPPRHRNPAIPGDLEIICLKAIAKEPSSRYGSAAAFGGDLRRWLDGRVITARRFTPAERAFRWARRNPLPASLAACLTLAVLSASVVTWIQNRQLAASNARLEVANNRTEAALNAAEKRVYFMTRRLPQKLEPLGNLAMLNEVFDHVDQYYREFGQPMDPESLARQCGFYTQWALILQPQGQSVEAQAKLDTAVELGHQAIALAKAGPDAWIACVAALRRRSEHATAKFEFLTAERFIQLAEETGQRAQRRFPHHPDVNAEVADVELEYGYMIRERGHAGDARLALETLQRALDNWRELKAQPNLALEQKLRIERQEAYTLFELGRCSTVLGAHRDALDYFRQNLAARDRVANENPDSPEDRRQVSTACVRVSDAIFQANDAEHSDSPLEEVERLLRRAEDITRSLVLEVDPSNQVWRSEWGLTALALGHLEFRRGNAAASRQWLTDTLDRLKLVTPAARSRVNFARAEANRFLAENYGASADPTKAGEHWNLALDAGFNHLCSNPYVREDYARWEEHLQRALGNWQQTRTPEWIDSTLKNWVARVQESATAAGASPWWWRAQAFLLRRFADHSESLGRRDVAAASNRKALELRVKLLRNEPRSTPELLSEITSAARRVIEANPPPSELIELVEHLVHSASPASAVDSAGPWRTEWAAAIGDALKSLDRSESAALLQRARDHLFPTQFHRPWSPDEVKARDSLEELESAPPSAENTPGN
ncbi:MAG: serine/threonine-protein kinase [Verrucomicrobiales bacterium]